MASKQLDGKGNERIRCEICGGWFHQLSVHLKKQHRTSVGAYQKEFPGAPVVSDHANHAKAQRNQNSPVSKNEPDVLYFGKARLSVRRGLDTGDQSYVPGHDPHYKFWNMDGLEAVATAIEMDLNLLMVGPTGCGKTSLVVELASLLNTPIQRINLDGDVRSSDFLGQMSLTVDSKTGQSVTVWTDGVLPRAMRRGHWLILDELDAAPPQILMTCQAVLEVGHRLVIKENSGEVIHPHPDFRIVATANTLGHGDQSGLYAGTNVINEATLDRFGIVIEYGYPEIKEEAAIVRAKSDVSAKQAKQMCDVAKKVRDGAKNDECFCTFSTRKLINWGVLIVKLDNHERAAQYTVLQRLNAEDCKYVGGIIQRVMGESI